MGESRRTFMLATLVAVATCSLAREGVVMAQKKNPPFPTPPQPAEGQTPAEMEAAKPNPQSAKRAALQQNEKEFRAGVDRLYAMAGELKQELDKTPTTEVFSVRMYKRTEEIEKVAKLLKGKAKG